MNHNMFHNPIVQDNIKKLKSFDYEIIEPDNGMLANGDMGDGRMPECDILFEYILKELAFEKTLAGKKVLVTAGPTREALDPVRYITNHSTGKMGYAIAKAAMLKGADVTLVSGPTALKKPMFVNTIDVVSAEDMYEAVTKEASSCDIIIKAAAVADYKPSEVASEKIKKKEGESSIHLTRTKDILKTLGEMKSEGKIHSFLCGFSMETENMLENSKAKLDKKNVDMIVANNLKVSGAGFGTDTNILTLITKDSANELPIMSKDECASTLLDTIAGRL